MEHVAVEHGRGVKLCMLENYVLQEDIQTSVLSFLLFSIVSWLAGEQPYSSVPAIFSLLLCSISHKPKISEANKPLTTETRSPVKPLLPGVFSGILTRKQQQEAKSKVIFFFY